MRKGVDELSEVIDLLKEVLVRLDRIERDVANLNTRLANVERDVSNLNTHLANVERKVTITQNHVAKFDERLTQSEKVQYLFKAEALDMAGERLAK
jgi:predicted  nucleic acid-binding Zn-ribbon protein